MILTTDRLLLRPVVAEDAASSTKARCGNANSSLTERRMTMNVMRW